VGEGAGAQMPCSFPRSLGLHFLSSGFFKTAPLDEKDSMRTTAIVSAVLASALSVSTAATAAPTKRPMTFKDMMAMKRLGETAVSPDGKWLLYGSKRDGVHQIFIMRLSDHFERRLTNLKRGFGAMWPQWQPINTIR
jgi:hypothetical protein